MEIRFEAVGPRSEEELLSLYDWLAADRALRGEARVSRAVAPDTSPEDGGPAAPRRMGPGLDAVTAVLSTVSGVGQLHLSYLAWRHSHRPRSAVTVDITGVDPAQVAELLRRFGQTDDPDGTDGADGTVGEPR